MINFAARPPLLSLEDLSVEFTRNVGRVRSVTAVRSLSLELGEGEILAVIGASGSGKTLLAQAILGILPANATVTGQLRYDREPLDEKRLRTLRGREISYIPQTVSHLDPLMTVGRQVRIGLDPRTAGLRQRELFARYGLADDVARLYPFQLSGGMLRRVLFATSIRDSVRLVVADEPTPGLHPDAVAEVLRHLRELAEAGTAVLLITHDIFAAIAVAQRIAVMHQGELLSVEDARAFAGDGADLTHAFARDLWCALPQNQFRPAGA
ncbi:ATP-binding cassette domain-containing protein [Microlunatus parietis]|uniref:Nickel import system ATP-binding protein NikD n=1 Tax=Microlunatus parietis TaxID=682979 RepID=A0A7Y9IEX9_9ACTN|nr:ATP-binding cassette domain-containing protein [Microlunatus parietis]NYE75381.1 peptide/nickel transport system ATP-binding protein [Microlunatus parietis]